MADCVGAFCPPPPPPPPPEPIDIPILPISATVLGVILLVLLVFWLRRRIAAKRTLTAGLRARAEQQNKEFTEGNLSAMYGDYQPIDPEGLK